MSEIQYESVLKLNQENKDILSTVLDERETIIWQRYMETTGEFDRISKEIGISSVLTKRLFARAYYKILKNERGKSIDVH